MADGRELFPPGSALGSPPGNGEPWRTERACRNPLGRRSTPRPQPALRPYRPPSPTLMMLSGIRAQLGDGFDDLGRTLGRLDSTLARNTETTADLVELVERLIVRVAAVERLVGAVEMPAAPRPNRRRPLE